MNNMNNGNVSIERRPIGPQKELQNWQRIGTFLAPYEPLYEPKDEPTKYSEGTVLFYSNDDEVLQINRAMEKLCSTTNNNPYNCIVRFSTKYNYTEIEINLYRNRILGGSKWVLALTNLKDNNERFDFYVKKIFYYLNKNFCNFINQKEEINSLTPIISIESINLVPLEEKDNVPSYITYENFESSRPPELVMKILINFIKYNCLYVVIKTPYLMKIVCPSFEVEFNCYNNTKFGNSTYMYEFSKISKSKFVSEKEEREYYYFVKCCLKHLEYNI
jgi:hypothetical protein